MDYQPRKYRLNKILDCYVSSSSSPYLYIVVDVYSRDNEFKGHLALSVQPDGEFQQATARSFESSFFDPPQYLEAEVKNAIKKHTFTFYENDQYGNERFEGLRYTDKELITKRFLHYANN